MQTTRRGLITGLVALVAAPAIVRASSLDLVRGIKLISPSEANWADQLVETSIQDFIKTLMQSGVISPNEARSFVHIPPLGFCALRSDVHAKATDHGCRAL
jgi:hypothetical protein